MESLQEYASPLSLENQCLVCIITDLDEFHPDYLALLPAQLCRKLLVNLPAIDICKLEKTEAVGGMNMCTDVWMNVCLHRLPTHLQLLHTNHPKLDESCCDYREMFFSSLSSVVLNSSERGLPRPDTPCQHNTEHMRFVEAGIFAVPNILGLTVQQWNKFQHSFTIQPEYNCFAPSRYSWIADPKYRCEKESQVVDILIEGCRCLPTHVWIDCESFMRGQMWRSRRFMPLLYKFLSHVSTLRLTVRLRQNILSSDFFDIPCFLLEAILWQNEGRLRHLTMDGDEYYVMQMLPSILPLLAHDKGRLHVPSIQDVHQHTLKNIPYDGLEELCVELDDNSKCDSEASSQLASIIKHQSSIKGVSLFVWPLNSPKLASAFVSLFHQPQFASVSLEVLTIHFPLFQKLMESFLSSSCKKLHLEGIDFEQEVHLNQPPCRESSSMFTPNSLTLEIRDIESPTLVQMLSCVTAHPSLHLDTFDLQKVPPLQDVGVLDLLCRIPDVQIKHLYLRYVTCSRKKSRKQWGSIFGGWNLSSVCFSHCGIGLQGLLPLITQGLRKQISRQTLQSFTLSNDTLGDCPDSEIAEFFCTIFSLPTVHNLFLDVSKNNLTLHHYKLLHTSWNKTSNEKQLDVLRIDSQVLASAPELKQIAVNIDTD